MKKLLIFPLLFLVHFAIAQSVAVSPVSFGTVADMRLQGGTVKVQVLLLGLANSDDDNGGIYRWDANSTATDDGFRVIKVTNITTGRWMRVGNGNTIKGTTTFSGTLLTTAYTVNYVIGGVTTVLPFVPAQIFIQARTQGAAQPSWITNITNSGFTINYQTVPLIGTLNIVNDFLIVKQ